MVILVWFLGLLAFRNSSVGNDTITYLKRYSILGKCEWENLLQVSSQLSFEYGYGLLNKMSFYIIKSARVFLFIISAFSLVVLSHFINKYSKMPWLSFIMYMALNIISLSFSGIRQGIALAFCMLAYQALKEKVLWKYILLIILASSFHITALAFLPMYWLVKIKFTPKQIAIALAIVAMTSLFGGKILESVTRNTKYYHYIMNNSTSNGAVGSTILYVIFLLLILLSINYKNSESKRIDLAFAFVSVITILLTFVIGIIERLSFYFAMFFLFSVPDAIMAWKSRTSRNIIAVSISILLVFYYIAIVCKANTSGLIPYEIWSETLGI